MSCKVGDRVGALKESNSDGVVLYGYGIYEGDYPMPLMVGKTPNPRIKLDSGLYVWGCECWWSAEQHIKESIGNRVVTVVSEDDYLCKEGQ